MDRKATAHKARNKSALVVAKASACTWVVAFSRRMIPGALFKTKAAALNANMIARSAGLRSTRVTVLGDA
jgi:hypothetical protein